jgi:predicted ATPase
MIRRGWALAEGGSVEEGILQLHQGLSTWRATQAGELGMPDFLAMLAEAYAKGGQIEEGLCILSEALTAVHKNGERHYEAELYRLKGELLLHRGRQKLAEAEESFWQAIDVARGQNAKSLELRAVVSLGRLWQQQGRWTEGRQVLTEIHSWFTEAFDTIDLQEATVLLEAST